MKKKFYIPLALMALGLSLQTQAQVSFNKRAIGSIGSVPKAGDFLNGASLDNVDMTTGTLKVGIPLYEIKVNDITVPISLNYTALGLKVGQEAGAPGMGWELSAGGKIVTNIQGKKDGPNWTDLYEQTPWKVAVVNTPSTFNPISNTADHRPFIAGILDNVLDGAWDSYNYILPNGGGTFVRNGLTFPYDPTIDVTTPGTIKTTDGLKYIFTAGITKKITKRKFYEPNAPIATQNPPTDQWNDPPTESREDFLWKIISTKFKDTVHFNYNSFIPQSPNLPAKKRTSTSESLPLNRAVIARNQTDGGVINDANNQWYKIGEPAISQSTTEVTYHSRLSTINYTNGFIRFLYRENDIKGRDVLTDIKIYQKTGTDSTLLKMYHFDYDENSTSYGHYLMGIQVYDGKGAGQGSWDFTYYDRLPLDPTMESKQQDRWGFYNAASTNKTLLENLDAVLVLKNRPHYPFFNSDYKSPTKEIIYIRPDAMEWYAPNPLYTDPNTQLLTSRIDFANRSPGFANTIKGTLKSVKTPTGGKFEYQYEPHEFSYIRRDWGVANYEVPVIGGGIRIKSVKKSLDHASLYNDYYTDTARTLTKIYKYGSGTWSDTETSPKNENGRGIGSLPGNVLGNVSAYFDRLNATVNYHNMVLLSHPVNNMSQYNGSYVMYPTVTEYVMKDPANNISYGKTVYYNNPIAEGYRPDYPWDGLTASVEDPKLPLNPVNPGVERQYISGPAGFKKYGRKNNGTYRLAQETSYTFRAFDAPQNSTNKLVSFFASMAAQFSGPVPTTPDAPSYAVRDLPFVSAADQGKLMFNNHVSSPGATKLMNFISNLNIVQDNQSITFQGKYAYNFIDLNTLSNCIRKIYERNVNYDDKGFTSTWTGTNYFYDNPDHLQATRIFTTGSKEDSIITRIKYAQDYPSNGAIGTMKTYKLSLNEPIEEYTTYKPAGTSNEYVKSGTINTFKDLNGSIFSDKVYQMRIANDKTPYNTSAYNGTGPDTNVFKLLVNYDLYSKGNVHKYTEAGGTGNVVIWGYDNQYPIAKVNNASNFSGTTSTDVAYTSFERTDPGSNWTYAGAPVAVAAGPSGRKAYNLAAGNITKTNITSSGKRYVISYWYKNGAAVTITGGMLGDAVVKNTWGEWSLAEREFSNVSGTVTISGTGMIDELRFHPYDSQMSTYTYEPLIGITGVIDAKGNLQFYEYDDSQRLKNIKDQRGNIVKSYRYKMGTLN